MKNKIFVLILLFVLVCAFYPKNSFAADSPSVLYVPLIGLTSVPDPLSLPSTGGNVTYNYAVKNFVKEVPLTQVEVIDDTCGQVKFISGDDNHNSELDYSETWRYACTVKLTKTTQSKSMALGTSNNILATHKAYATVVVGTNNPPPLVSIVNITKIAYPLSLPAQGGDITFTYKVNNPGVVPLSDVSVTDNKCNNISGELGDTNGNSLLDINEVWIYTCTMNLKQTTTNTATVTAFANGLRAVDEASITVPVQNSGPPEVGAVSGSSNQPVPSFPNAGTLPGSQSNSKIIIWVILGGILAVLVTFFFLPRKSKLGQFQNKPNRLNRK